MSLNRETSSAKSNQVQWEIRLFGGLQITRDGQPVSPPPYRTYGLLAFLCLWDKLPIRRERLGGFLYADLTPGKIRGRINDHIWQIKKYLPEFPLITTIENIDLNKQSIRVDVKEFFKEINHPDDSLNEKFIELYRGELLPELYDDWVLVERERWHSQYLRALRTLIDNLLGVENFERAVLIMERLLRVEPYDESVVRLLMQTCVKLGRRGAALAAYEKFQVLSVEQIGLEPDARTKKIYNAIKSQATTPRHLLLNKEEDQPVSIDPDQTLIQAQSALEQGNRIELKRLLDTLPKKPSYDQALGRQVLEFDEKLAWGELEQAEKILLKCKASSPTIRLRQARLALAKYEYEKAGNLVETLLDDAHRLRQPHLEADALIVLSLTKAELGEIQDSLPVLDRAISLSRKLDIPAIRVQAYIQKGRYWQLKGAEESAHEILEKAVAISRQYNLRLLLIQSLNSLALNCNYYGKYHDALKYLFENLELVRDLSLPAREAATLLTLSATFDFLGRHTETAEALKSASKIYKEQENAFGLARCYYNLAYSNVNNKEEKISDAINYAEKALRFFSKVNNLGWQASTHTALGYLQWLAGHADQALKNFDAAIKLHTELDEQLFIPEICAYKGLAYLQKGDPQQGLECTQFAVRELTRSNLSDVAAEIYYAHACVFQALGNEQDARFYIERGYEIYLDSAKGIQDDNARVVFFERDPITRKLMKMVYDFGLAPRPKTAVITHQLPGSAHYQVKLELTVDAGAADQALEASVGTSALRRVRLKRILQEGSGHGGQLTIKEMAELFNVSRRTIQRDLKLLEEK